MMESKQILFFCAILFVFYLLRTTLLIIVHYIAYVLLIYFAWNLAFFLYSFDFVPKKYLGTKNRAILITGCDSGFGLGLAEALYARGFYIFATCLDTESLGAKKLKNLNDERILITQLNVTDDASVKKAKKEVEDYLVRHKDVSLWALVNNAGVMSLCEIEFGNLDHIYKQIEINCMGLIRTTRSFLPLIRHNHFGRGRIINIASQAGRFAMPGFSAYCFSKAMVISFNDCLRREMHKWNIEVVSIEPHLYRTNLVNLQRLQKEFDLFWNETDESIQNDYGRSYYEGFQRTMIYSLETARKDIERVINAIKEAIILSKVQPYYRIANKHELIRLWFWEMIAPIWLIDLLMRKLLTDCNGTPAMLTNRVKSKSN
ncbi:protein disabled [Sarcoptes scabiei]|nr:protein disabled [Sarcoptes scabiei]